MNKKLTLCLFILERQDFTLRFLKFYNEFDWPYQLIIGDGSKLNVNKSILNEIRKNKNIQYFKLKNEFDKKLKEYNHNKFYSRILFCLKKVKTKYVKFISDDDLPIAYSTLKCINLLEKNNNLDAAGGSALDFSLSSKYYGKIKDIHSFYNIQNFKSKNVETKVKQFYNKTFDCWHIVFRTNKINEIFKISSAHNNDDKDFKDHFHELITHIFLKIYFFKDPLIFHESHNDPHDGALRGNVLYRLRDHNFLHKLEQFSKSANKVFKFKNKNFITKQYYRGIIVSYLNKYNYKSYHSLQDIAGIIKQNIKTKIKKYQNVESFLKKNKNNKLKKELILLENFLLDKNI